MADRFAAQSSRVERHYNGRSERQEHFSRSLFV